MKRLLEIGFIVCVCFGYSQANILKHLGIASNNDLSLFRADVAKNADSIIKANTKIAENAEAIFKLDLRIGKIEADAKANVTGVIGVGNKTENTNEDVGGDKNTSIVNETPLLQYIFEGLFALMTAICIALITTIRAQNTHIKNLVDSSQKKDTRIWELTNNNITILLNMVDQYSEICLGIIKDRMAANGFKKISSGIDLKSKDK